MTKIVRLIVLIVLAFLAYDYGWPWLQGVLENKGSMTAGGGGSLGGSGGSVDDGALLCVDRATAASDEFGAGVGQFTRPGGDRAVWMRFAGQLQKRVSSAQLACGCSETACQLASEALFELDTTIQEIDGVAPTVG